MVTFSKRSGIFIPKSFENEDFYWNVKEFLRRRSKNYQDSTYTVNRFYKESSKFLLVPRFFPIQDYIGCQVVDKADVGEDISISHCISLRNELQEKALKYMLENDCGIVQLQPGTGKTVISIRMIAERKKKAFILVHRDSLVDQWRGPGIKEKQGFLDFTNLEEDDVVRLTSSNYEEALKKPVIVTTDQTFLSLLKRDRAKFLDEINKANIGVFVADEVHTSVGAPTFSECSLHVPARVVFGLSATPYRWDGNSDVISFHLGEVFSDEDITGTMDARITVLMFDFGIARKSYNYIFWGGEFQRARYLNLIKKSPSFLMVAKALLNRLKDERDLLFVAERLKLIDNMYNWVKSESKSKFVSSAKNDQLCYKVVFATPGKIRDGVDIPKKDCLIMTSPISNIAQICGRVVRTLKGKQQPIILDMVDIGCSYISNTLYSRLDYYASRNWKVQFVLIMDKEKKIIDEDTARKILKGEK